MRNLVQSLMVCLVFIGSDLDALVKKLGSPRYAEREEASAILATRGRSALAALREGRTDRDPEIRTRSIALFERIETALLTSPTLVSLDPGALTTEEIIADLTEKTGFPFHLDGRPLSRDPVSLPGTHPGPQPFWTLVEALCRQRGLDLSIQRGQGDVTGESLYGMIALQPVAPGTLAAPSSVSGPFRVSVLSMTRTLEKSFTPEKEGVVRNPPFHERANGRDVDQFTIKVQVLAEPRMTSTPASPPRVTLATDNLGNNLISQETMEAESSQELFARRFGSPGIGQSEATILLQYPDHAGGKIDELKGVVPVLVTSRKSEPLTIPLAESSGKIFRSNDSWITIHDVRFEPNLGQTTLDLAIRSVNAGEGATDLDLTGPGFSSGLGGQIEIHDHRGLPISQWHVLSQTRDAFGLRVSLRMTTPNKPPAELQFFDLVTSTAQVDFEFKDLPMP